MAQEAFRFETLEDSIVRVLAKCTVAPLTQELVLGSSFVSARLLLEMAGLPFEKPLETRTGRILARLGYRKVRRSDGCRYLAPGG